MPADKRQNIVVSADYRKRLALNLQSLMGYRASSAERLKAPYLDGTKKGQNVSTRSIRNAMKPEGPAPGVDAYRFLQSALLPRVDASQHGLAGTNP